MGDALRHSEADCPLDRRLPGPLDGRSPGQSGGPLPATPAGMPLRGEAGSDEPCLPDDQPSAAGWAPRSAGVRAVRCCR